MLSPASMGTHEASAPVGVGGLGADLQTILDAFPYYVMLVDSQHTILMANRAVKDALGVEAKAIVGGHCPRVVHGHDEAFPGCPLETACARGCSTECELNDTEHGRILVSGVYETPLKTPEGRPVYLHTTRDITEQRQAQDALARSERTQVALNQILRLSLEPNTLEDLFEKVLGTIATLSWTTFEPRSIIFLTEENGQSLVPVAHRNMPAETLMACAKIPLGDCVCGLVAQTRKSVFVRSDNHCHTRRPDSEGPHAHYCAPIVKGDQLLGVLNLYAPQEREKDATELEFISAVANVLSGIIQCRRAEDARLVHERIALTRERMARVGEIATGVAHLVRNPLQGVMNCLDILAENLDAKSAASVGQPLALMREGLQRIGKVTDRLLTLTQETPFRPRSTDVLNALDEVRAMLGGNALQKKVTFKLEVSQGCHAHLDSDRFVEAVANVVGNAVDASPTGGEVVIRAQLVSVPEPQLVVEVLDSGPGIPVELHTQVFDPFFSTKPIGKGSGLGLAITRRILDEHGGTIVLDSEVGKGTKISLLFPMR
jgi:PAS domain S-box-containing protein